MGVMSEILEKVPWSLAIVLALTLGLAPFTPPHLVEKLAILVRGELRRAIDWLDLLLHATPWILLLAKSILALTRS